MLILAILLRWNKINLLAVRPAVNIKAWFLFKGITLLWCLFYVLQFILFYICNYWMGSVQDMFVKIILWRWGIACVLWFFVIFMELKGREKWPWLWALGGFISGPLVFYIYLFRYNLFLLSKNKSE